MLFLKQANLEDIEKEYNAVKKIPEDENGLENKYCNCSFNEFKTSVIKTLIDNSKGINLKEGYVPCTWYFLWQDDNIIGLYKLRHYLSDSLREGSGHIGYCILKEYRGNGYATKGLKLLLDICKDIVKEDEIYFRVRKSNIASLKVQLNNGAKIVNETDDHYFTRIKIK